MYVGVRCASRRFCLVEFVAVVASEPIVGEVHAIQISHMRCDPDYCGRSFSSIEFGLDTANRSFAPSMVATHSYSCGRLDVGPTVIGASRYWSR